MYMALMMLGRQRCMYTIEPLVTKVGSAMVDIAVKKLKIYKLPVLIKFRQN
jgi:hypothetical protein